MTTLTQQIEEMRLRMNQMANSEQDLIRALGDALGRSDQKLLQDVRAVAMEHEMRRGAILGELQSLAARMGALPRPRGPVTTLEEAATDVPARETVQPAPAGRGDWRQAAANIQDEVAFRLNRRASAG
jgi:hypothetical protein